MFMTKKPAKPRGMQPGDQGFCLGVQVQKIAAGRWIAVTHDEPPAEVLEDSHVRCGYAGPRWAVRAVLSVEQQFDAPEWPEWDYSDE
jgi:hypothetical protein